MLSRKVNLDELGEESEDKFSAFNPRYALKSKAKVNRIPKYEFPLTEMEPRIAYQRIHDELSLDGNPFLNLASFVHTWMEPEADKLMMENISKNIIDVFEYPQTDKVIHSKLVNMIGRLFNGHGSDFVGTATVGSSEAIMLGLLAHKWTWRQSRQKAGKPADKPNIVFGEDAHVCWDKFARYFDVVPRKVPLNRKTLAIDVNKVGDSIDENTICVGGIVGTTFTGAIDPIEKINKLLIDIKEEKGWDIPIHIDAASGGFILPFTKPKFKWDFRLEQVKSINVSGHKYGMTYAGLGWLIFKDKKDLPEDLIFRVNYLGEEEETYTLNFSRGSSTVVAQYYNILRFGMPGYTRIMENVLKVAQNLAGMLKALGRFEIINDGNTLPIIAFKQAKPANYSLRQLSHKIREKGWIVPAYCLPNDASDIEIMRVVVRENFTNDMAQFLANDIDSACKILDESGVIEKDRPCKAKKHMYNIC